MESPRINVLLIEDRSEDSALLREMLCRGEGTSFDVACATRLQEGLERLAGSGADVVLLDLSLPDSQGLATFTRVQMVAPEIPTVILTAFDDTALALEAVRKGAQDYLVKGQVDGKMLSCVIRYAIERHRMQAALRSLSLLDELTGLYNRRGFLTLAAQHLKLAQRTARGLLLLLADLDGLKQINDTFGHQQGDEALIEAAEILKGTFRTSDVVARIGGDEFAVIAIEALRENADTLRARVRQRLGAAQVKRQSPYRLSLSVGAASVDPQQTPRLDELLAQADRALYEQKQGKRHPHDR